MHQRKYGDIETRQSRKERRSGEGTKRPMSEFSYLKYFQILLFFGMGLLAIYGIVAYLNYRDGMENVVVHNNLERKIFVSFYVGMHPERLSKESDELLMPRYRKPAGIKPGEKHSLRRPMAHKHADNEYNIVALAFDFNLLKKKMRFGDLFATSRISDEEVSRLQKENTTWFHDRVFTFETPVGGRDREMYIMMDKTTHNRITVYAPEVHQKE